VWGWRSSKIFLTSGRCWANIYHVSHDRHRIGVPMGRAEVHLELETRGPEHVREILGALRKAGYQVMRRDG
jgi:threonine dehydratase